MFPISRLTGNIFRVAGATEQSLRLFGQIAQLAGVTTATDLVNDLSDDNVQVLQRITAEADFPVRLVPAYIGLDGSLSREAGAARVRSRVATNTDKLHFGLVKIVTDGSIQGFTARVRWPGYFNGHENGIWIQPPAELRATIAHFHAAGFQLHIHTNGDEATELAIDGIEAALAEHPRADHRHTLQHCQMADAAQFRRMARLGICANLFANHIYYWGDAHHALTMGPDRAERMDACATALKHGVPLAIHSDAPITPLGPMFTAWCAVNRLTSSGRVLGASERIGVADALRAITLGAAYTLGLDDRIGSIEVGKFADFCVLDDDPLAAAPEALKDVRIAGTVLGGRASHCRAAWPRLDDHRGGHSHDAPAADRHRRLPRRRQDDAAQSAAAQFQRPTPRGAGQRLRRAQHRCRTDCVERRRHDPVDQRLRLLLDRRRPDDGADRSHRIVLRRSMRW